VTLRVIDPDTLALQAAIAAHQQRESLAFVDWRLREWVNACGGPHVFVPSHLRELATVVDTIVKARLQEERKRRREQDAHRRAMKDASVSARPPGPYRETGYIYEDLSGADKKYLRRESGEESPCRCCLRTGLPSVLDHDHATGLTRGWICPSCNISAGHLETRDPLSYARTHREFAAAFARYHAETIWTAEPRCAFEERYGQVAP